MDIKISGGFNKHYLLLFLILQVILKMDINTKFVRFN